MAMNYTIQNFHLSHPLKPPNSPRSIQACLILGVDPFGLLPPLNLRVKPSDASSTFVTSGNGRISGSSNEVNEEEIRSTHNEKKRHERVQAVLLQRERIIRLDLNNTNTNSNANAITSRNSYTLSPLISSPMKRPATSNSTFENTEITRMANIEKTRTNLLQKLSSTEKASLEKKELYNKLIEERKSEDVMRKISRDAKRITERDKEVKRRNMQTDIDNRNAQNEVKMKYEKDELLKRELYESTLHALEKTQIKEERLRLNLNKQFELSELSRNIMLVRDVKREQTQKEKQIQLSEINEKLSQESLERRLKITTLNKTKAINARKAFELKQEHEQATKTANALKSKLKTEEITKEREEKATRNKKILLHNKHLREHRKESIQRQIDEKEEHIKTNEMNKQRLHKLKKINDSLDRDDRIEKIERLNRASTYATLQTSLKLSLDDRRTELIKDQKARELEEQRVKTYELFLKKAASKDRIDKMRISNSWIDDDGDKRSDSKSKTR